MKKITFLLILIVCFIPLYGQAQPYSYSAYLAKLPHNSIKSVFRAADELKNRFKNNDSKSEVAIRQFDQFHKRVIANLNHTIAINRASTVIWKIFRYEKKHIFRIRDSNSNKYFINIRDKIKSHDAKILYKEHKELFRILEQNIHEGLLVYSGHEGFIYVRIKDKLFYENILKNYRVPLKYYITMREKHKKWVWDAATSWPVLRKRLVAYECFAKKNPDLKETKEKVLRQISLMMDTFLCGVDNTRIYDYGTVTLNKELHKNYKIYLSETCSKKNKKIIYGLLEIYKLENFRPNTRVVEYLKRYTERNPLIPL